MGRSLHERKSKHVFNVACALVALCCSDFSALCWGGQVPSASLSFWSVVFCRPRQPPLHPLYDLLLPSDFGHGQAGPHPPGSCHPAFCCCSTKRGTAYWVSVLCAFVSKLLQACSSAIGLGGRVFYLRLWSGTTVKRWQKIEIYVGHGATSKDNNFRLEKVQELWFSNLNHWVPGVPPTASSLCQLSQLLALLELCSFRQRY